MMWIFAPFKFLGGITQRFIKELGRMGCFFAESLFWMVFPPYLIRRIIKQINFIGVKTTPVIILTGSFTGMVLALQTYYALAKFGAQSSLGPVVALSLIRELGPVISALMVTGCAGSALTAEIGIMRITEQIDALDAMALNPYKYLIIPNLIGGIISLPLLNAIFVVVGVFWGICRGGWADGLIKWDIFPGNQRFH